MMRIIGILTAAVIAGLAAPAAADPMPLALRGKSFVVSWSEQRVQRDVGEAAFRTVHGSHVLSVYISKTGRVFTRMQNTTRAGTGRGEQVTGSSKKYQMPQRVPTFTATSMTLYQPFISGGMRRIVIDFDGAVSTCKSNVIFAKEEGHASAVGFSPITKRRIEFQSVNASAAGCTVKNDNVFANELT